MLETRSAHEKQSAAQNIMSYEMQGLTWQAKRRNQQDAILINHKVIQHKGVWTKHYQFNSNQAWCVAVADGVSSNEHSGKAASKVLEIIDEHFCQQTTNITFSIIQDRLCKALAENPDTYIDLLDDQESGDIKPAKHDPSTTMVLLRYVPALPYNQITIQSLGDSRAYAFCNEQKKWVALTRDDNFYEELLAVDQIKYCDQEVASSYYVLTEYFCANWLHEAPEKPVTYYELKVNDALLICTDGVFDALGSEYWPPIPHEQSLEEWLDMILEKIRHSPNCHDNVSMILVRGQLSGI